MSIKFLSNNIFKISVFNNIFFLTYQENIFKVLFAHLLKIQP